MAISADPKLAAIEVQEVLQRTANRDLNLAGYPKTPPTAFDPDTSWDVSPVAPFDKGDFNDEGWSAWFGFGKVDAAAVIRLILENLSDEVEEQKEVIFDEEEFCRNCCSS